MSTQHTPLFVEADCKVGGCLCPAWADWFEAIDDTGQLEEWPFDPLGCGRPDTCHLYAEARGEAA